MCIILLHKKHRYTNGVSVYCYATQIHHTKNRNRTFDKSKGKHVICYTNDRLTGGTLYPDKGALIRGRRPPSSANGRAHIYAVYRLHVLPLKADNRRLKRRYFRLKAEVVAKQRRGHQSPLICSCFSCHASFRYSLKNLV